MVTPAIFMGFLSGSATGIASTRRMINGARATRRSSGLARASIPDPSFRFQEFGGWLSAAGDHPHQHPILAHDMMEQGGADVTDEQDPERDAERPVHDVETVR